MEESSDETIVEVDPPRHFTDEQIELGLSLLLAIGLVLLVVLTWSVGA